MCFDSKETITKNLNRFLDETEPVKRGILPTGRTSYPNIQNIPIGTETGRISSSQNNVSNVPKSSEANQPAASSPTDQIEALLKQAHKIAKDSNTPLVAFFQNAPDSIAAVIHVNTTMPVELLRAIDAVDSDLAHQLAANLDAQVLKEEVESVMKHLGILDMIDVVFGAGY